MTVVREETEPLPISHPEHSESTWDVETPIKEEPATFSVKKSKKEKRKLKKGSITVESSKPNETSIKPSATEIPISEPAFTTADDMTVVREETEPLPISHPEHSESTWDVETPTEEEPSAFSVNKSKKEKRKSKRGTTTPVKSFKRTEPTIPLHDAKSSTSQPGIVPEYHFNEESVESRTGPQLDESSNLPSEEGPDLSAAKKSKEENRGTKGDSTTAIDILRPEPPQGHSREDVGPNSSISSTFPEHTNVAAPSDSVSHEAEPMEASGGLFVDDNQPRHNFVQDSNTPKAASRDPDANVAPLLEGPGFLEHDNGEATSISQPSEQGVSRDHMDLPTPEAMGVGGQPITSTHSREEYNHDKPDAVVISETPHTPEQQALQPSSIPLPYDLDLDLDIDTTTSSPEMHCDAPLLSAVDSTLDRFFEQPETAVDNRDVEPSNVPLPEDLKPEQLADFPRDSAAPVQTSDLTKEDESLAHAPMAVLHDHNIRSFAQDIDFAATVAAGLEGSGFDPNIVFNDPSFHQRLSPPLSVAEADPEEVFIATKNKGKKAKPSRTSSVGPSTIPETAIRTLRYPATDASAKSSTDDFAATLVAGLQSSGFDPNLILDPTFSQQGTARTLEAEPEGSFTMQKRPKKGKMGKKAQSSSIPGTPLDSGVSTPRDDDRAIASIEPMETLLEPVPVNDSRTLEPAELQPIALPVEQEDYWSYTTKKKGKKGVKGKRASVAQEDSESQAVESPLVEAPAVVPPVVETPTFGTPAFVSARESPSLESPVFENPSFETSQADIHITERGYDGSAVDTRSPESHVIYPSAMDLKDNEHSHERERSEEHQTAKTDSSQIFEDQGSFAPHVPEDTIVQNLMDQHDSFEAEQEPIEEKVAAEEEWASHPKKKGKRDKSKKKKSDSLAEPSEATTSSYVPEEPLTKEPDISGDIVTENIPDQVEDLAEDKEKWAVPAKKKGKKGKSGSKRSHTDSPITTPWEQSGTSTPILTADIDEQKFVEEPLPEISSEVIKDQLPVVSTKQADRDFATPQDEDEFAYVGKKKGKKGKKQRGQEAMKNADRLPREGQFEETTAKDAILLPIVAGAAASGFLGYEFTESQETEKVLDEGAEQEDDGSAQPSKRKGKKGKKGRKEEGVARERTMSDTEMEFQPKDGIMQDEVLEPSRILTAQIVQTEKRNSLTGLETHEGGTEAKQVPDEEKDTPFAIKKKGKKGNKGRKGSQPIPPAPNAAKSILQPEIHVFNNIVPEVSIDTHETAVHQANIQDPKFPASSADKEIEPHGSYSQETILQIQKTYHESVDASEDDQSPQSKLTTLSPGLERVKRRAPTFPISLEQPQEKRIHLPEVKVNDSESSEHIGDDPTASRKPPTHSEIALSKTPTRDTNLIVDPPGLPQEASTLTKPTSNQSLSSALEPTWSFPPNRDSAVHVSDSPLLSTTPPLHNAARDSGYHDTQFSPVARQGPDERFENTALKRDMPEEPHQLYSGAAGGHIESIEEARITQNPPAFPSTSTSSADPLEVSVEVDSNWDLSVSKKQPPEYTSREPLAAQAPPEVEAVHEETARPRSPSLPEPGPTGGTVPPSPVDPTTKDRTSYLFQSSPSTRDLILEKSAESPATGLIQTLQERDVSQIGSPTPTHSSISRRAEEHSSPMVETRDVLVGETPVQPLFGGQTENGEVETEQKPVHSLFGDESHVEAEKPFPTTPARHVKSPSAQLDTITEYSPEESPLAKKSRAITNLGAPDHEVKSVRRSGTPKSFHDRLQSPSPHGPGLNSLGKGHQSNLSQTPATGDDFLARLSPPHVDEEHEMVGIDRSLSLSPARRLRHDQRSPPITIDPTKRSASSPLSPTAFSDRSGGSVTRFKTPDHLRPLSAASNRSATPPLRRVDRSLSGDLRAASRLGEVSARGAKTPSQQSDITIPGPSTYDPLKDKGKARAVDMADVYVSCISGSE
ncbi:hypothetical protein K432DRAFT_55460 [Lepidopterella palustris CBS 459.81]|uniref:Uncharacterized protein n=1 Tax=Lepidopterella palustris CBS 459.81 TaxID=1314670 RepID=A0A8E2JEU9_9PEZI|nr:hypothetical protein K432DRAFT_55460 [Lepidopterella palustris CBS 459.81]